MEFTKKCNSYILFEIDLNRSYKFSKNTNVTSFQLPISRILIGREHEERKKTLRSWEDLRNSVKFSQANSWKAHGVPFGATVQNLEHRIMLISKLWRFQKCHWERWNRPGTLDSIPGEGCLILTGHIICYTENAFLFRFMTFINVILSFVT